MVQGILRIVNVFVYNKGSSTRFLCIATIPLENQSCPYIRIWRMSPYFAKISYNSSFVILYGKFLENQVSKGSPTSHTEYGSLRAEVFPIPLGTHK